MTKPLHSALRLVAILLMIVASALPAFAQVTIFSPFNIAEAMDPGVKKTADIPYADGQRKKLDIYRPKDMSGPAPVVMFIYGGSWRAGDKFEYEFAGRALAASGFVTVIADYRLWPDVKYPDFLEDCAQAMRWIQDNIASYGGDPKRARARFLVPPRLRRHHADPRHCRDLGAVQFLPVRVRSGARHVRRGAKSGRHAADQPRDCRCAADPAGQRHHRPDRTHAELAGPGEEAAREGRMGHREVL
ncbi:MAG: alpha/beta hydrolase [Devosia sp.]|nr:alpha/beta hydrolase [Devosia sp.]